MLGIELESAERTGRVVADALRSGWLVIGEGEELSVLSLTPPLAIAEPLLTRGLDRIVELCLA